MSKIFEYKAGSFIEQISKTVMTPTDVSHRQTEKGVASVFNGASSKLVTPTSINIGKKHIIHFVASFNDLSGTNSVLSADVNNTLRIYSNDRIHYRINATTYGYPNMFIIKPRIFYSFMLVRDGVSLKMYLNNILTDTITMAAGDNIDFTFINIGVRVTDLFFNGYLKSIDISDDVSDANRNKMYYEFLYASPTEKPVRGFELVKPTDLSYQKTRGLFAAYNFKRNGNILTDISGNGNNFTISPGVVTQDNGLLFPLTNATITPSMLFPAGSKTVCWRGIVHSVPETFARIYGSYLLFNSNMRMFYRAQSDTIVTINTGLSATQFGKEFDLVFVQESNNSQKLYINGVLVGTSATETTSVQQIDEISSTGANAGIITHKDLRFYTRAFSDDEVKAYHNSWVKPEILEDWSGSAVGDTI